MEIQNLLPSGCNFGALTSATYLTAVPAPGENRARLVFTLGVHNTTGGVIQVNVYISDSTAGPVRYQIDGLALAAAGTYSLSDKYPNGIFLRGNQFIELNAGAATTEDWYVAWAELPQLGYRGR